MQPILSVVIPCFKEAEKIGTQLEALSSQSWHERWEVIVSDDGSTDGSRQVVEQYRGRLPCLRVVESGGRRGRGHAYNAGAAAARGKF